MKKIDFNKIDSLVIYNKPIEYKHGTIPFEIEINAGQSVYLPKPEDNKSWKEIWKWAKRTGRVINMTRTQYQLRNWK